jgi:hypothetical protein
MLVKVRVSDIQSTIIITLKLIVYSFALFVYLQTLTGKEVSSSKYTL